MVSAANKPIQLTLIAGSSYSEREAWICNQLPLNIKSAVLLEGLPDGESPLGLEITQDLLVERVASGCFCCAGNMVLRVVLNRLIRQKPAQIFIAISQVEHLSALREFLQSPPYADLLMIQDYRVLD